MWCGLVVCCLVAGAAAQQGFPSFPPAQPQQPGLAQQFIFNPLAAGRIRQQQQPLQQQQPNQFLQQPQQQQQFVQQQQQQFVPQQPQFTQQQPAAIQPQFVIQSQPQQQLPQGRLPAAVQVLRRPAPQPVRQPVGQPAPVPLARLPARAPQPAPVARQPAAPLLATPPQPAAPRPAAPAAPVQLEGAYVHDSTGDRSLG